METWIIRFAIATIIVGLIKIIWFGQDARIKKIEDRSDKEMDEGGTLTHENHDIICNKAMTSLKDWLEVKFELLDTKIENEVLKELQKLNGGKK
mgnify:CR=1 FL=1